MIPATLPTAAALATACLIASTLLTGGIRAYARRKKVLDIPNERSSHTVPTPRGGGAAIVLVSALAMGLGILGGMIDLRHGLTLLSGMVLLAVIGWLDDTIGLSPSIRFPSQVAAAIGTVWALGGIPSVRVGPAVLALGPAGYVLGVIGIVWCINLFNFMDGIDGIAGSQALLIFAFGAATLFLLGHGSLGTISLILAAASAGFLAWNWPPAKIFMGDVGSGAIGYAIGALAIASENDGGTPVLAFALLGGVFIVDATVTLVRRVRRGHSPAVAHRDHAYQRLSRRLGAHAPVTILAGALTAVFGIAVMASLQRHGLLLGSLVASWALLAVLLLLLERTDPMFPSGG